MNKQNKIEAKQILCKSIKMFEKPGTWVKDKYDSQTKEIQETGEIKAHERFQVCAIGAVHRASGNPDAFAHDEAFEDGGPIETARHYLEQTIKKLYPMEYDLAGWEVERWNDLSTTTVRKVLRVFRTAVMDLDQELKNK